MVGSIFALILGLALLGLAAWLLLRAKTDVGAGVGSGEIAERAESAEIAEGAGHAEGAGISGEGWSAEWDGPQFDGWSGVEEEPDSQYDELGEGWSEDWDHEEAESAQEAGAVEGDTPEGGDFASADLEGSQRAGATENSAPRLEPESSASGMAAFGFPRRRRRQWAADNGFEYTKEDVEVARAWPIAITGDHQRGGPTLREVVSGFVDGHQVHIGDLGSSTLMAMRRVEESPVQVLYSSGGAQPAGMRRTDLLDQPPFAAYTTDVRALDRMLDARVEDALAALSQVASDVAWGQNWTVVRVSRKLDFHVWEEILPQLRSLVDAAMVLPPAQTSAPLEMLVADQLRPLPGGPLQVHTDNPVNQEEIEEQAAETSSRRAAHLRAVPDGSADADSGTPAQSKTAAYTDGGDASATAEEVSAHAEVPNPERPDITRPAEPVAFPSRTHTRWEGGDTDSFDSFAVGDYDDPTEDDNLRTGRRRRRDGGIPRLGEDPEHMSSRSSQYAQVIRVDAEEATIFEEVEETKSTAVRLSAVTQRRRSGGRHRAPEARHARPEPIEPIEYETVDGEVVEDDQK